MEKADEKERARLHLEARTSHVERLNAELEDRIQQLQSILQSTLDVDDFIDLNTLKIKPTFPAFSPPSYLLHERKSPDRENFLPIQPSGVQKLIPGTMRKYQEHYADGMKRFEKAMATYREDEKSRLDELKSLRLEYERRLEQIRQETAEQHTQIDALQVSLKESQPDAVVQYCSLVMSSSVYPDDFPQVFKVAFVPESKQIVVEYDLPPMSVIPEIGAYKYMKTKDEISTTSRPMSQRKSLYTSVIAQLTLRTVHELFEADRWKNIDTAIFNGYVNSVDAATGRDVRVCLVTLRTTRETFESLDLRRVDPELCLKTLNASVSKSASELAPVRPVLEFSMVDPRFVEEADVMSTLDQRPNLMELTPSEFESLITNLFQKMGLEARQTQASRDGGVDCVAFDPRPIFGGKVVIQAKRYKNTVGVSAVRDLFGTLQNEGASKGILVTTSGYGKAAFEFAEGKPIELLDGTNLLYLLKEHADIDAKIIVPNDWKEPVLDSVEVPKANG